MDLFRAEAYAALSGLCFLQNLAILYGLEPNTILHATDSKSLITHLDTEFLSFYPPQSFAPHWDVTAQLVETLKQLPSMISRKHIRAHQDLVVPQVQLTVLEVLNI